MTVRVAPPRLVERLLARAVRPSPYQEDIVGDLHEAFCVVAQRRSATYARLWYCAHALRLSGRYALRARPKKHRRGHLMDRFMLDLRFANRSLAKRPLLATAVVATLAVGIGANAAVFAMIDALVLRPLAMHDVDRIIMAGSVPATGSGGLRGTVSPADFLDLRRMSAGGPVQRLSAFDWWDVNLVGRDEPERVQGFFVSADFFDAIGYQPALGRLFLPENEIPANSKRVVLGDGLWKRRFGGDPAIIGQTILADATQWTVVGIMPPGIDFPMGAQIWAPLSFSERTAANRRSRYLTIAGHLAPGRSIEEADAHLRTIGDRLAREYPASNRGFVMRVRTISKGMMDEGVGPILALWQAAGVFVLLIACANIANLLLARGTERGREIAVRLALGSSRARMIAHSMTESALLAFAAIPLSLAVMSVFLHFIRAYMPARIARFIAGWSQMAVDYRSVGVTVALAVLAALTFGILPALQMSRGDVAEVLKSDGRSATGTPGRRLVRYALVVAEIALVLPLLVAALMSVRSVTTYLRDWQGYDPNGVLTIKAVVPDARYPDADSRARFVAASVDALAAVPSVRAAAAGNSIPAIDSNARRRIEVAGQTDPSSDESQRPSVNYRAVTPAYFGVLRIPILSGRAFSAADAKGTEPVVVVSQAMARKFWPDGRGLDGRVRVSGGEWLRVVGVCGDVIHDIDNRNEPIMYRPFAQAPSDYMVFIVHTAGDPAGLAADARRAIASVDPMQPLFDIMPMRQVLGERTIGLQYVATIMSGFAGMALILAVLGLYAVMSYLVAQRVREIGVRIALGATPADVSKLALGQAARLTALGVGIGLAFAFAVGRLIESALMGIVSAQVSTTMMLAALLAAVALASSYLPARRAAMVDPMVALRAE